MSTYLIHLALTIGAWYDCGAKAKQKKAEEDYKAFHDTIIEYRC